MAQQDNDEVGKLFVGGINRQTTEDGLKGYFEKYGEVTDCVLMKDKETGLSRGFGFVTFVQPSSVTEVLKEKPHTIDNKIVDPKPCTPRHIQQQKKMSANQYSKGHKIFIGGISMDATEDDVKSYFERYGVVVEVVFVVNKSDTSRPHKGFGFVTYEDESSVDQACAKHYHVIKDKRVEAKKAESREKMDKANEQQGQYTNMGYGQGQMQGNMGMGYPQQGMNQGQWMGGQMMGNYGYGNQNFPTAYPQQYGANQAYGYGYGGGQGYGGMQQQQQQQQQQQMGGNMQGYGNMQPNPGMMGGMQGGMQQGQGGMHGSQNNGSMRGQGDMGSYQQNPSGFGPTKPDYNSMGGGNMSMKSDYGSNQNQMGGSGGGGGGGGGGYGPPGKQSGGGGGGGSGSNSGYHPYRR